MRINRGCGGWIRLGARGSQAFPRVFEGMAQVLAPDRSETEIVRLQGRKGSWGWERGLKMREEQRAMWEEALPLYLSLEGQEASGRGLTSVQRPGFYARNSLFRPLDFLMQNHPHVHY